MKSINKQTAEEYNKGFRYVAYYAPNGEYKEFKTIEDAKDWLTENDSEGISEESINGQNYIAEIQYKSKVTILESKEDYCTCSDDYEDFCENCNREVWPYNSDFDWIGKHEYIKINWE